MDKGLPKTTCLLMMLVYHQTPIHAQNPLINTRIQMIFLIYVYLALHAMVLECKEMLLWFGIVLNFFLNKVQV